MTSARHDWTSHILVRGLRGVGLRTVEQLHFAGARVAAEHDDPDPRPTPVVSALDAPRMLAPGFGHGVAWQL